MVSAANFANVNNNGNANNNNASAALGVRPDFGAPDKPYDRQGADPKGKTVFAVTLNTSGRKTGAVLRRSALWERASLDPARGLTWVERGGLEIKTYVKTRHESGVWHERTL